MTNAHRDPDPQTTIWGNVGVYAGVSITGFPPGIVLPPAGIHQTDSVAQQAQSDSLTAYNTLAAPSYTILTGDLGLQPTRPPGVYRFSSSAQLTGTLTLDFASDPDADFVFQIGTRLTTASGSIVIVINGGPLSGVYWQVGTSASLGSGSAFAGNILADQSINLDPTAKILCGRAIALNAAVTLIDNLISNNCIAEDFGVSGRPDFSSYGFSGGGDTEAVPEPGTVPLLCAGLLALTSYGRQSRKRVA